MAGTLYLVATPIGNLGDITLRALEVLRSVAFVVCEDTRHSGFLLQKHGVEASLRSLPAFDEKERTAQIVADLSRGQSAALITDAGSPGISDPGEFLVSAAVAAGVQVVPIPGATALVAALTASGLPTSRFHFLGFLPRTTSDAQSMLEEVRGLSASIIAYESPKRLVETLRLLERVLGSRRACVARELTKVHESFTRDALGALAAHFEANEPLGEVVIVVEGAARDAKWSEATVREALISGLARGERLKTLAGDLAKEAGWASADVYRLGLSVKA